MEPWGFLRVSSRFFEDSLKILKRSILYLYSWVGFAFHRIHGTGLYLPTWQVKNGHMNKGNCRTYSLHGSFGYIMKTKSRYHMIILKCGTYHGTSVNLTHHVLSNLCIHQTIQTRKTRAVYKSLISYHDWLVVSTHLKNISQIGSFPQVGLKIKKIFETTTQMSVVWYLKEFTPSLRPHLFLTAPPIFLGEGFCESAPSVQLDSNGGAQPFQVVKWYVHGYLRS